MGDPTELTNRILDWLATLIAFLDRHEGAIATVATVVIAAFTVALAVSTKKLWIEARRAGDTAEAVAEAARDSADAATKSVDTWKQMAITHLRAYVSVEHPSYFKVVASDKIPSRITFRLKNNGQTPANKLSYWMDFRVSDIPFDGEFEAPVGRARPISVIAPGAAMEIELHFDDEQTEAFSDELRREGNRLYVWGAVTYEDVFQNPQWTTFAYYTVRTPPSPDFTIVQFGIGNDAS